MRPSPRVFARLAATLSLGSLAFFIACGGGGSSSGSGSTPAGTGTVDTIVTDSASDQWSTVGVVVTKITLLDKADHSHEVVAFNGTSAKINLVDLDSVGELLAQAQVPAGTYDAMRITIDSDPSTVTLIDSTGATVPTSKIHVLGSSVTVTLNADLVVTAGGTTALQADFDLAHPLFLYQLPNGDWVLNLQVRHKVNPATLDKLVLHHHLGTVTATASSSFTMQTVHGTSLDINVDAGAKFIDVDNKTTVSGVAGLANLATEKNVLVTTRVQPDGSLWAVRVWSSASALPGLNPEGHVYGVVRGAGGYLIVSTSTGAPRRIYIDDAAGSTTATDFTWHQSTDLGTGTAVLDKMWRGFKVSVTVKDPLAAQLHADTVNIERAVDGGFIDASTSAGTGLTYDHPWGSQTFAFASSGFSWWYYSLPGASSTDQTAFLAAIAGAGASNVRVAGVSDLSYDASAASGWDVSNVIILPTLAPVGTVAAFNSTTNVLAYTYLDTSLGTRTINVGLNPTPGLQPFVLNVQNSAGVVTVSQVGVANWGTALATNDRAVVALVPKADGSFAAYAVVVFNGF